MKPTTTAMRCTTFAQSYRRNDDMDNAKTYYQKFADLYPGTERAANAQRYLNTEE